MSKIFEEQNIIVILIIMVAYFISVYLAKKSLKKEYNRSPNVNGLGDLIDSIWSYTPFLNLLLLSLNKKD